MEGLAIQCGHASVAPLVVEHVSYDRDRHHPTCVTSNLPAAGSVEDRLDNSHPRLGHILLALLALPVLVLLVADGLEPVPM